MSDDVLLTKISFMRLRSCICLMLLFVLVVSASIVHADTYSTFQRTRYYSPNRRYFVEVTEKKTATLYHNKNRRLQRIWRRSLLELPRQLMVSNNGQRIIIIDRYYGNGGQPTAKVITILGEKGEEIASYELREVANRSRALQTTSTSHWYGGADFSPDGRFLVVKTIIRKRPCPERVNSAEEADECTQSIPYERLRFDLTTGKLIERASIESH